MFIKIIKTFIILLLYYKVFKKMSEQKFIENYIWDVSLFHVYFIVLKRNSPLKCRLRAVLSNILSKEVSD